MTKQDRKILWKVERLLKQKKMVFCAPPEFIEHRNFPANGVVVSDEAALRRLQADGYLKFSSTRWQYDKKLSETSHRLIPADVIEGLTDKWTKDVQDYDRHRLAIASFFILGVLGAAIAIYREFWK